MHSRQEFIQIIVKAAVMLYILSGRITDVSDAVYHMLVTDLVPNADPAYFTAPNVGRNHFYTEPVDAVLRKHEASLRNLFDAACLLGGRSLAAGLANRLVAYPEWVELLRRLGLIQDDLTERDATLCFVWSRMRYVDEEHEPSRVKLTHLAFTDFLEAVCRVAGLLALPTDRECECAGVADAGAFLEKLGRDEPDELTRFRRGRAGEWGKPSHAHARRSAPGYQSVARCVEHTVQLIIYNAQYHIGRHGCADADEEQLSAKEACLFLGVPDLEH